MARALIDIRSLARAHCPEAIKVLAGIMNAQMGVRHADKINAAIALLDRGYGKPQADADGREAINITIRKILEGSVTVVETTTTPAQKVIEHEP